MADTYLQPTDPVPYLGTMASFVPTQGKPDKPKSMDDMAGAAVPNFNYDAVLKSDTDAYKEKIGADAANDSARNRRDDQYRTRMDRMIAAEGATMDDIKPWNAEKELAEHKTDLWSQLGSPGFIIAMVASAFTAQPMNSALMSGAAAMNAINQGDADGYNKAFDAYKENANLALKRIDLEKAQYEQIEKLRTSDMAAWRAQAESIATRFNDKRMLAMLQNGYDGEAMQVLDKMDTLRSHLAEAHWNLLANQGRLDLFQQYEKENNPNHDPKKMSENVHRASAMFTDPPKNAVDAAIQELRKSDEYWAAPYEKRMEMLSDAMSGTKPTEVFRIKETARHNEEMEKLAEGRLDATQARQNEINRHNEIIEGIQTGKLEGQVTVEEERARHDRAMEDIDHQKVDVSRDVEAGRNKRAELSSSTKLEVSKLSDDTKKEIEAARLQVEGIKEEGRNARTGAQIEGQYERLQLSDKAKKEIAGMNASARKELTEFLEKGRDKRATEARETKDQTNPKWLASPQGQKWIKSQPEEEQPAFQAFVRNFAAGTDPEAVAQTVDLIGKYQIPPLSGWVLKSDFGTQVLKGLREKYPNYSGPKYYGGVSAQRAAGTRGGNIAVSAVESDRAFKLARVASDNFPRGEFVPFNRLKQMSARTIKSNPKYTKFLDANEAAITAYSATMSRNGANTVHAQERADRVLSQADSQEAYNAGLDQLQMEVNAVRNAPAEAAAELLRGLFNEEPASGDEGHPSNLTDDQVKEKLGIQ